MLRTYPLALLAALLLAGCSVEVKTESKQEPAPPASSFELPEGAQRIGEEITVAETVKLATLREDPSPYLEKTVLIEAEASEVCQSKGCWLTIADGDAEPIWVRWSTGCGGKYAFPKESPGRRLLVQGTLSEKVISEADAEHLAGESEGLKAEEIQGKTFEVNATACVLLPSPEA